MIVKDIYDSWCTEYTLTLEEFLAEDDCVWRDRLVNRALLIIKGMPADMSDEKFHSAMSKFGNLWTVNDYHSAMGKQRDPTQNKTPKTPVSYFKTTNNYWKDNEMKYHADMAHIGDKSFPARALYMCRTANNGSGETSWLNLELAYEQFTDEEKEYYSDVDVYQHFMYEPGTNIVKYPFLKTNPFSGKLSPRMNCFGKHQTWIHHVDKAGVEVESIAPFMNEIYRLCESKKDTVYTHHWSNGDILVYDNWNGVHRRDPVTFEPGEPDRLLKRVTFNIAP